MRVLLLDNIDSFTWNIFHYLEALDVEVRVIDNTAIDPEALIYFDALVVSPGPGLPNEAGKLMSVLEKAIAGYLPVLGVCLGMQAIAEHFGGSIFNQETVKHGQQTAVTHDGSSALFENIPATFKAGLYHSWAVSTDLPATLKATAFSEEQVMMALEHKEKKIFGVQFHPESILSEYGKEIFRNFLHML